MPILQIDIINKVAAYRKRGGGVVCGNTDYVIEFSFDSEWEAYQEKTARFIWGGKFYDVTFKGTTCAMPMVRRTDAVSVGVYAGELCTTTPAVIPCQRSVLCGSEPQREGSAEQYTNEAKAAADRAEAAADAAAAEAVQSFAELSAEQLLGGIVQTPGNSETAVMSQKATTEGFNALDKKFESVGFIYTPNITEVVGYFINKHGVKSEINGYSVSAPFPVSKGYTITLEAFGAVNSSGEGNVAMISKATKAADGTSYTYTPLVVSTSPAEKKSYSYMVEEDGEFVVSWNVKNGYKATVSTNAKKYRDVIVKQLSDDAENKITDAVESMETQIAEVDNKATNSIAAMETQIAEAYKTIEGDFFPFSTFHKFGVVGDSFASGACYYDGTSHNDYPKSWGQVLARKSGNICTNFSRGGLSTRTWLNDHKGLSLLNATEAQDLYILALGINDMGIEKKLPSEERSKEYLGTVNDIANPGNTIADDTFYGNYGKIIQAIKNKAHKGKIIMSTMATSLASDDDLELRKSYNNAIIAIANYYGIPYIVQDEDSFFTSSAYKGNIVKGDGHPNAIGYGGMANAIERLIQKCIANNQSYFADALMYDM